MELIPVSKALDMLSAQAPRIWCARVIGWEILEGNVLLASAEGNVVERRAGFFYLLDSDAAGGVDLSGDAKPGPKISDTAFGLVRDNYGEEIAKQVRDFGPHCRIEVKREEWKGDLAEVDPEFVYRAKELNWEQAVLFASFDQSKHEKIPEIEWFYSDFDD